MTTNSKPITPDEALDPSRALVPSIQQVNEVRVQRGFWPKIRRTAARIPFARQIVSVWYAARDPETPTAAKGVMLGALAYFVLPVDAIPDIFAGIGFTDDAAVITALIATLGAHIKRRHKDQAEAALKRALDDAGRAWELNEGDGAFYGPKIDITVFDALRRKFQCGTIQLDFQLPLRFKLSYATEDGPAGVPVIVHRAILGSVERMFAILTEHFAGKWPLWLSPRQVMVVPISEGSAAYAKQVRAELRKEGFHVEVDLHDKKMQKKVREAQLAQFNYILVVGEQEREARTVNVRTRDNKVHGMHSLASVVEVMRRERREKSKGSLFDEMEGAGGGEQEAGGKNEGAAA